MEAVPIKLAFTMSVVGTSRALVLQARGLRIHHARTCKVGHPKPKCKARSQKWKEMDDHARPHQPTLCTRDEIMILGMRNGRHHGLGMDALVTMALT